MSFRRLVTRAIIAGAAFTMLTLGYPHIARADVETCGAHLRPLVGLTQQPNSSATTYAYVLRADTGRSVEGKVVADTDHGWFEWEFPMSALSQKPIAVHVRGIEMNGRDYESDPLYVTFPPETVVKHAWVEQAKTQGETVFDWDARGWLNCSLPDFGDADIRGVPEIPPSLPSGASATTAKVTDARLDAECEQPFIHADVVSMPRLGEHGDSSGPTSGVGVYAIAIDDKGAVLDAWTVGSSGNPRWDTAASTALRLAKFAPPVSYCLPVAATIYMVESFRQ